MPTTEKKILTRLYVVAGVLFLFAMAVAVKLVSIQVVDGEKYKQLALDRTERVFVIEPNRGNLISDDGSLLATSVSKYTIRFDAVTVRNSDFNENVKPLADALGKMFHKPSSYYQQLLRKAKSNKNRYKLIARIR